MKAKETRDLIIRPMTKFDVHDASIIEEKSFSMPWSEQDFWDMTQKEYAHYYVSVIDDTIVGICGVLDMAGEGDISNVAVDPERRRENIGYRMLEQVIRECKELGMKEFTLEVRESNEPAIKLYEKLGFVREGIRPGFYEKPTEDALILWKRD